MQDETPFSRRAAREQWNPFNILEVDIVGGKENIPFLLRAVNAALNCLKTLKDLIG